MDGGAYVTLSPVVLSRGALARGRALPLSQRARARAGRWRPTRRRTARSAASVRRRRCLPRSCTSRRSRRARLDPVGSCASATCCGAATTIATGQRLARASARVQCSRPSSRARGIVSCSANMHAGIVIAARPTSRAPGSSLVSTARDSPDAARSCSRSRAAVVLTRAGRIQGAGRVHRDGAGDATIFAQIDGRRARRRHRPHRDRGPRHVEGARQRSDRREPHRDDRRQLCCSRRRPICAAASSGRAASGRPRPGRWRRSRRSACGGEPFVRADAEYQPPPGIEWDEETYRGDAYSVFAGRLPLSSSRSTATTFEVTVRKMTHSAGHRQGDQPAARRRADRGRHRAGPRLRAARVAGLRATA